MVEIGRNGTADTVEELTRPRDESQILATSHAGRAEEVDKVATGMDS